jgi:hypothetical protein
LKKEDSFKILIKKDLRYINKMKLFSKAQKLAKMHGAIQIKI